MSAERKKPKNSLDVLRQSEERYKAIFDLSPEVIVMMDTKGNILEISERLYDMIGYEPEEVMGKNINALPFFSAKTKIKAMEKFLQGVKDKKVAPFELDVTAKDGKVRIGRFLLSSFKNEKGKVAAIVVSISDVTGYREAEAETKELKEHLQLQVDRMPIGLIVWDEEFRVKAWNPAAERIFGFKEKETIGKHPYDLIVPREVQPQVDDVWRRLLEGDTTAHSVNENITKDGRTITCSWANTPLKHTDGSPMGAFSMVQDVTEKMKTEEELRANETRFKGLFDSMKSGVAIYGAEGDGKDFVFRDINKAGARLSNVEREDVMGKKVTEVFPGVKDLGLFEVFQKVWKTGKPESLPASLYKDKRLSAWYENYVYKLPSGEIVAIYDDVTERKRSQDAIKRAYKTTRDIIENAPFGIYVVNEEGDIEYVNQAMLEISGDSQKQFGGLNVFRDLKRYEKIGLTDKLRTGLEGEYFKMESVKYTSEIGEKTTIRNFTGVPLEEKGKRKLLMIVEDITEREQVREKLRGEASFRDAIIEHAADGLCVCHGVDEFPHVNFTVWNKRMFDITGHTMEEINIKGWYQSMYPDPEVQRKAIERMERMRQGDDLVDEEWEITQKDGKKRTISISTTIVAGKEGQAHVLAMMHDVTEAKKSEKELIATVEELKKYKTLVVGRENKMIELKKEVNELSRELGRPEPYDVMFGE